MAKELKIRITGDASGLKKATDESEGILSGFGSKISAFSVATGLVLAEGIKSGFSAAVGFLGDSIGAATDMNETISKVGVLFGDAAGQIETFAAGAATAFGQSKQQAMDAAATFATFGKSAGLSGSGLADFSTDLVGLASDMASFSNTSPEEAIEAIGAALRGEAEPIRRFGVLLDDATLRQKALEMGIISTTKDALTPQQKVLAAQAAIFDQTAAAQGDFARTSGGLANQQRILSANIENLKARIGQGLLPVALKLTAWFNTTLIPAFSRWITEYGPAIEAGFQRLAGWVQKVVDVFQQGGWTAALGEVGSKLKDLWLGYMDWFYTTALPAIGGALAELGRMFGAWVVDTAWPWLVEHLGIWLGMFGDWFTGTALPWLGEQTELLAQQMGEWIKQGAIYLRENLPGWLGDFAEWFAGTALPWLVERGVEMANKLADWVEDAAVKLIRNLPGWITKFESWVRNDALPAMARFGVDAAIAIKDALIGGMNFMADIASEIVSGLISGLWSQAGRLGSEVQSFIASTIPGPVRDLLGLGGGGGELAGMSSQRASSTSYATQSLGSSDLSGGGFQAARITVPVSIDGKQVALATAPYTRQLARARN